MLNKLWTMLPRELLLYRRRSEPVEVVGSHIGELLQLLVERNRSAKVSLFFTDATQLRIRYYRQDYNLPTVSIAARPII